MRDNIETLYGAINDGPLAVRIAKHVRKELEAYLGCLTRIFEDTVQGFYARRARQHGHLGGKTGSVTVVQRTSSDLRLHQHS